MCLMLLLVQQMVFFRKIYLCLQLSWIGQFWTKWAFLHFDIFDLPEGFFQKPTQFSLGNNVLDALLLTQMVSFWEIHLFLQVSWLSQCGRYWAFLPLENYDLQEVFLSELSQFSQGNNVLDPTASNTDRVLSRDTCVSWNQLNRQIWIKESVSQTWTPKLQEVFLSKTSSILTRINVLHAADSHIDGFLWRDKCVFSTQLSRPIWRKENLSPPWNPCDAWSIPFKNILNFNSETMC
jgi:hypothetical protein